MVLRVSFEVLPMRDYGLNQYIKGHIVLLKEYTENCDLSETKMECESFFGRIKGSDKLIMSNILLFFKHGNIQLL